MSYWKFIATWETETECYIRRLFGNDGDIIEKTGQSLDVGEGDTLFLHRWRSGERGGHIDGPFVAESPGERNIVENAWSHKAQFDWQVRIGWEDTVYTRRIEDLQSDSDDPLIDFKHYPQSFSETKGIWLTAAIKKGTPIVSPP